MPEYWLGNALWKLTDVPGNSTTTTTALVKNINEIKCFYTAALVIHLGKTARPCALQKLLQKYSDKTEL